MPFYRGFYFDTFEIIEEALEFAGKEIDSYLLSKRSPINVVHRAVIDEKRKEINEKISSIKKLLKDKIGISYHMLEDPYLEMMNIVRSSLKIYLRDLRNVRSATGLVLGKGKRVIPLIVEGTDIKKIWNFGQISGNSYERGRA